MCSLRRAQDPENHTLSKGIYDPMFQAPVRDDFSPRASLSRADPNVYAELNRRNREFWEGKGGLQ
jgi:hypothetical protein